MNNRSRGIEDAQVPHFSYLRKTIVILLRIQRKIERTQEFNELSVSSFLHNFQRSLNNFQSVKNPYEHMENMERIVISNVIS